MVHIQCIELYVNSKILCIVYVFKHNVNSKILCNVYVFKHREKTLVSRGGKARKCEPNQIRALKAHFRKTKE